MSLITIVFPLESDYQPWSSADRSGNTPYNFPIGGVIGASIGSSVRSSQGLPDILPKDSTASDQIRGFQYDWYFRIHTTPAFFAVGNLLSTQTRDFEIWNAHFDERTLTSISEVGTSGIVLTEPAPTPLSWRPLQARTYSINIATNGPAEINGIFTFNFGSETRDISITGRRTTIWPFIPQRVFNEVLEWKTDVIKTFNGEQRLALRQTPRQEFEYTFYLDDQEFSIAKAISSEWAHRVYGVPVWGEMQYLGVVAPSTTILNVDTTAADYRDDDVLLIWQSNNVFESVGIQSGGITDSTITLDLSVINNFTNAYVMPMRFGRAPSGTTFQRLKIGDIQARLSFLITDGKDLSYESPIFPLYRDYEVLLDRSVVIGSLDESIIRDVEVIDNSRGVIVADVNTSISNYMQTITWSTDNRAERWRVRRWLHSRRGKQKAFWLPSWNKDLELLLPIDPTSTAMTVKNIGYSLYYTIKDCMIVLFDGTIFYRRILGGSRDINGNETLVFDSPLDQLVGPGDIERISFLTFCRLDADRIELSHLDAAVTNIRVPVMQIQEQ